MFAVVFCRLCSMFYVDYGVTSCSSRPWSTRSTATCHHSRRWLQSISSASLRRRTYILTLLSSELRHNTLTVNIYWHYTCYWCHWLSYFGCILDG